MSEPEALFFPLAGRVLDGDATAEEHETFRALLRDHPEWIVYWREQADLDALVHWRFGRVKVARRRTLRRWVGLAAGLAACLAGVAMWRSGSDGVLRREDGRVSATAWQTVAVPRGEGDGAASDDRFLSTETEVPVGSKTRPVPGSLVFLDGKSTRAMNVSDPVLEPGAERAALQTLLTNAGEQKTKNELETNMKTKHVVSVAHSLDKVASVSQARRVAAWAAASVLVTTSGMAADAFWSGAGGDSYWTNALNWTAGQVPGLDSAYQNAFLTNVLNGTVYGAVLDASLPYSLGTLRVGNSGAGGEVWVTVDQAAVLGVTNLQVRTGGGVRIDNHGVVTNTQACLLDENGAQLVLDNGGGLFVSGNLSVGVVNGTMSNRLSLGESAVLVVTNGTFTVGAGRGIGYNRLDVNGDHVRIDTYTTPVVGAYGSFFTEAAFTGTDSVWDLHGTRFYLGSGSQSNRITVSQGSVCFTNSTAGFWVGYSNNNGYDSLLVTNGGRFRISCTLTMGYVGGSNSVFVTGEGSLYDGLTGSRIVVGGDAWGNRFLVDRMGTISNSYFYVGNGNACGNSLTITNGAKWFTGAGTPWSNTSIVGNGCSSNTLTLTGSNTFWNADGRGQLTIGAGAAADNLVCVDDGASIFSGGMLNIGNTGVESGNALVVKGGGRYLAAANQSFFLRGRNTILVSGKGSELSADGSWCNFSVGAGSTGAVMTVENDAVFQKWTKLFVGVTSNSVGNTLFITNGGYVQAGSVIAGGDRVAYVNLWSNRVVVASGGVLEASAGLYTDSALGAALPSGYNCITNGGGIYQFTSATPTVSPVPADNSLIYLTDGTISFRAVSSVNVKGNWSGTALTNILFSGHNAFRLNTATNATSPNQSYVFAGDLGSTNYARLELFNSSYYRGGSVTIGNGGSLCASGTPSSISDLTITSGGTLDVAVNGMDSASQLIAVGSVTLGGNLNLTLSGPPPPEGFEWKLIDKTSVGAISGQFDTKKTVVAVYGDAKYAFSVNTTGGDGNDLVLRSMGRYRPGMVVLVF